MSKLFISQLFGIYATVDCCNIFLCLFDTFYQEGQPASTMFAQHYGQPQSSSSAPSHPQQLVNFVLVEYPGVVKNTDAALTTLGGVRAISSAHFANTPLELQFQPDNPFHSGMVAERKNQSAVFSGEANLVLRIRRKKKTNAEGESGAADAEMDIRCIGMISTIYSFKTICDFQYLPLSNTTTVDPGTGANVHHELIPHMVPSDCPSAMSWWDEQQKPRRRTAAIAEKKSEESTSAKGKRQQQQHSVSLDADVERFLPPYQFSRFNNPSKFILHDDVDRWVKKPAEGVGHARSLRNERKALTVTVNAGDPFPYAPSEKAVKDVELRCKNAELQQLFADLFAERPMWNRIAIAYRTRTSDNLLKVILAKYAFYIVSGPWGRIWCRFGYDPRTDPEARCYQSIVVSFKRNQYIPERQRLRAAAIPSSHNYMGQFYDYVYTPKTLPPLRQMWYQVCDVQLPIAQKICQRNYFETLRQCDPTNGWLPAGLIDAIRTAIKTDVALSSRRLGNLLEEGGGTTTAGEDDVEELDPDFEEHTAGVPRLFGSFEEEEGDELEEEPGDLDVEAMDEW